MDARVYNSLALGVDLPYSLNASLMYRFLTDLPEPTYLFPTSQRLSHYYFLYITSFDPSSSWLEIVEYIHIVVGTRAKSFRAAS